MEVRDEPISSQQPLAAALISDFARVGHLYGNDPMKLDSWKARAKWLDASVRERIDRKAVVHRLREYNAKYNHYEAVARSLDRLEQEGTSVIVGGQQAGLFTGPLLVIYKAITIIQAAAEAERELCRPVVPVFWIAGEDHDWDEVNHVYMLSGDLQLNRIRARRQDDIRTPVSYTKLSDEEWSRVISELAECLPDSEIKRELLAELQESVGGTLTDSFAKLMGNWFGRYGLILMDSADPELRRLEAPVFEKLITRNQELRLAYLEAADQVRAMGHEPQADVAEDGVNLFYIHEGERLLLFESKGRFGDRKGIVSFTPEELVELLQKHPDRFSNNVLTRPLMQDSLLPVLGTVLGAGEIAYWALTKGAFEVLGLQMPLLLPRMSFTIVDSTVQKNMERYNLSFGDVKTGLQAKKEAWLAEQVEVDLDRRFLEVKSAFEAIYEPLISELGNLEKGLLKLGATNKEKITQQMDFLRGRAKDAVTRAHETALRHWDLVGLSLYPQDKLQERVYNVFTYINRYGYTWINTLMELPYRADGSHRLILL
ncbi:bacillithiol biosynthesis cysteine-adding enzyme BshC [Paenibacillus sp. CAA11]|uniref:bacillithiol biosynthesis cysteine-adding enzyme BshC n=1 Tax=Paenibacillus sp. CAA11 TaxID=1532905 RepID=UPI000D3DA590|nr:bacillithiol biosynthesis cysteine-adding enzyme BshC [Paenibacillus sp. CAA11]AWB45373.1 bacillithiol biosynthesis cysteine-adding enzyme BshC [Paenibacillus sp. CAA11]